MAAFAISVAVLVLGSYVILGAITVCSYLRSDRYPPEAAEAPKGDDVMALADAVRKPISADLDGDLPTGMLTELYEAIDAYKRGEFIEADAPKEWA